MTYQLHIDPPELLRPGLRRYKGRLILPDHRVSIVMDVAHETFTPARALLAMAPADRTGSLLALSDIAERGDIAGFWGDFNRVLSMPEVNALAAAVTAIPTVGTVIGGAFVAARVVGAVGANIEAKNLANREKVKAASKKMSKEANKALKEKKIAVVTTPADFERALKARAIVRNPTGIRLALTAMSQPMKIGSPEHADALALQLAGAEDKGQLLELATLPVSNATTSATPEDNLDDVSGYYADVCGCGGSCGAC